jgi:hypothetical protein
MCVLCYGRNNKGSVEVSNSKQCKLFNSSLPESSPRLGSIPSRDILVEDEDDLD